MTAKISITDHDSGEQIGPPETVPSGQQIIKPMPTPNELESQPSFVHPIPTSEPPLEEMANDIPSPEVPRFGTLQPKVDAHPLFSGDTEPRPKNRRWLKRTLAPVLALLVVLIILYLAIDAGLVKGYSHLPFHFFKAPVTATSPVITPAKTATTTTPTTTPQATDPYAGWKTYTTKNGKMTFKYPANLYISDCVGGTNGNSEESIYLLSSAPPDCSVYQSQGGGPPVYISLISSTVATQNRNWSDYTNVRHTAVTIDSVSGTRTSFDYTAGSAKSGVYYSLSRSGEYWYFEDSYGNQAGGLQPDVFDALVQTITFK